MAAGFRFATLDGGSFARIDDFPSGIDADDQFVVRAAGSTLGIFGPGQACDFAALLGAGVAEFEVLGIDPLVEADDFTAFPLKLSLSAPNAQFSMTPILYTEPVAYCSGDGTGAACPCGNNGAGESGCASSVSSAGARLRSEGVASIVSDTFALVADQMPNASALFFQGSQIQSGGQGAVFGDGLRCAAGSIVRLGNKQNELGASRFPMPSDPSISSSGGAQPANVLYYQVWYRNAADYCTAATFNLTNGVAVTWAL